MSVSQEFIASLNDAVARRTRWGPASGGGANFKEHTLVEVSPRRLEFRLALGAKFFYGVFITLGAGSFVVAIYCLAVGYTKAWWFFFLASLLPGVGGSLACYFSGRRRVFDLDAGIYWKGRPPADSHDLERRKDCTALQDIHALQLVRETVQHKEHGRGDSSSFYSYEINLVLKNGSRINVVDHGNLDIIQANAARIGKGLGVPVWDATPPLPQPDDSPAATASSMASGCALVLGTVIGGFVLFIIGCFLLIALSATLDRHFGHGTLWGLLILLTFGVTILIISRSMRRRKRSQLEVRSRDADRGPFSSGWTYEESPRDIQPIERTASSSPSMAGVTESTENAGSADRPQLPADIPYKIHKRPLPEGDDIDNLLPTDVGPFQREEIRADLDPYTDPIYVDYTDGDNTVNIEFGICRSVEDAQQGVRTAIIESADVCVATEAQSVGTDPSFHKSEFDNPRMGETGKGVGIAWSRGRYYLSAGARSRATLDRFMEAFPY